LRRQEGQTDNSSRFDDGGSGSRVPPPFGLEWRVRGVQRRERSFLHFQQPAQHFAESVATVAHRQQFQAVLWTRLAPASGDQIGRGLGGQCSFEFVGDNENV